MIIVRSVLQATFGRIQAQVVSGGTELTGSRPTSRGDTGLLDGAYFHRPDLFAGWREQFAG